MDKNKEPIKTRCPLSESGDLEEAKGEGAERVRWSTKPHGDELGAGWFSSIGQEKLGEEEFELGTEERLETWSELRKRTDVLTAGFCV